MTRDPSPAASRREGLVLASQRPHECHVFVASKIPTERDLHCWLTHQTDKRDLVYRVDRNGRVLNLTCERGLINPTNISLENVTVDFRRTIDAKPFDAEAGDIVSINASMHYTKNLTRGGRARVTDMYGQLKPEHKNDFLQYLEFVTGLDGLANGNAQIDLMPHAVPTEEERRCKVQFHGAMEISMRARVADADVFNSLAYRMIGQRKSYGFGALNCIRIERKADVSAESHDEEELSEG